MAKRRKLFFELPFSMEAPRLTNPSIGIARVVGRGDKAAEMEITLLDAPDNRLLRAGVMLAHRVVDGLGEWYLDAPTWQPWLPADHAEPLGAAGDLPDDLAELVRPFRRRATLGPVAAVTSSRTIYTFKDADEVTLGTLTGEQITIRRNGLTTARFREATLVPSPAMSGAQRRFLADAMRQVGGIQVESFPDVVRRLGAPATGLTDYPEPREWDAKVSLETFVSQLFATRLQEIMRADLALRASELARRGRAQGQEPSQPTPGQAESEALNGPGLSPLLSELAQLRHQVSSLAGVLEPTWRALMVADLAAVIDAGQERSIGNLDERYYAVLDNLIAAVRAPQLGDMSQKQAAPVLRQQLESGMRILIARCHRLRGEATDADWEAALEAARQLLGTTEGLAILFGKLARRVAKQLRKTQHLLEPCQPVADWPDQARLAEMSPEQAFSAGRELQRAGDARDAARARFVREWPEVCGKLMALRTAS